MPRWRAFRHVVLPQLAPYIAAAARSGLSLVWKIVLVAELLGRPNGVGFEIGVAFQLFDIAATAGLFADLRRRRARHRNRCWCSRLKRAHRGGGPVQLEVDIIRQDVSRARRANAHDVLRRHQLRASGRARSACSSARPAAARARCCRFSPGSITIIRDASRARPEARHRHGVPGAAAVAVALGRRQCAACRARCRRGEARRSCSRSWS